MRQSLQGYIEVLDSKAVGLQYRQREEHKLKKKGLPVKTAQPLAMG
jgi:hypothetical protein